MRPDPDHPVIPAQAGIQHAIYVPRSGQRHVFGVIPLRGVCAMCLDSRLRGNDGDSKCNCHEL
jgi:hypothetical protein